ncbi:hypothetical protein BU24DRAFT_91784 [Aaosphaeria arxii CBS 175.79]|uniref:Uncharacterized protein n=1 Tax=Aaosphaeria arxii CBS 175.79 TaxID=1450172 RepID=A0A6A5X7C6_9PLEO|nr:uncharacterized protein BU24DRAFT_91784 [Aaosphaeria arxii CBS 175.79]KAF2008806.1 hypothetical protein BU24DRAFT_91784 [Aaosphaeria arxii CBS 175.79]
MEHSYTAAMAAATAPTTMTQWKDEQPNVPSVAEHHRDVLRQWLDSLPDAPVAKDRRTYLQVVSNWTAFLSATSLIPSPALAPNNKKVIIFSGDEEDDHGESPSDMKKRFLVDRRERFCIQGTIWRLFDGNEALLERWPVPARRLMNRAVYGPSAPPLSSMMSDIFLQRRWNSVWTSLICFLIYCEENDGSPEDMGLTLSEELTDDLLDISQALMFDGYPKPGAEDGDSVTGEALRVFITNVITALDSHSVSPRTNPLLWWMTVLVHSSLSTHTDFISRGHFTWNILPMDLDIAGRIDAVVHYTQVMLLDLSFRTWKPTNKQHQLDVVQQLDKVDNSWIVKMSSTKPAVEASAAEEQEKACETPAFKDMLAHVEKTFDEILGKESKGVVAGMVRLKAQLAAAGAAGNSNA